MVIIELTYYRENVRIPTPNGYPNELVLWGEISPEDVDGDFVGGSVGNHIIACGLKCIDRISVSWRLLPYRQNFVN